MSSFTPSSEEKIGPILQLLRPTQDNSHQLYMVQSSTYNIYTPKQS